MSNIDSNVFNNQCDIYHNEEVIARLRPKQNITVVKAQ